MIASIKKSNGRKGVALIFFLLIFGVMLSFLMIIVNTGVLVFQKVKLQSTVDLASYAGASVQAAYLGNEFSGEQSIAGLNRKIYERYGKLVNDLQFGNIVPWNGTSFLPLAACIASCQAANLANTNHTLELYRAAVADIEEYREQINHILASMPAAVQKAVEATVAANIEQLKTGDSNLAAAFGETTNKAGEIIEATKSSVGDRTKNAVLTFLNKKGFYLANEVANVPHQFAIYGPPCFPQQVEFYKDVEKPIWYCAVNGAGAPGGPLAYVAAQTAWGRSYLKGTISGNMGTISRLSDGDAKAIRLRFMENPHRPQPFVLVSSEWYPPNGVAMNLENSLGAKGSLFPKKTRLVATSLAEPFGASLTSETAPIFGTRLQAIRKVLLDPRMSEVKGDYNDLFDYMNTLAPLDRFGRPIESPEQTVRRFLH